ncbi:MAG: carbohydrate ABC transporter permease [Clostridia bacterium]
MITKRNWGYTILSILFLSFIVAIIILPFMHMVAVSFSDSSSVLRGKVGILPVNFNLKMYQAVFQNEALILSYANTIFYTVVGTAMSLAITSTGAYALSRKEILGHKIFSFMILFTMFFSGGMIPTYLVVRELGMLDTIWAVLLPGVVSTWNFIIMRSFFQAFPKEIEEAGSMDGLNDIGVFFRLVVPSSSAVFATIGLYYAVAMWNAYFGPFIYLNDKALFPLQLVLREVIAIGSSSTDGGTDVELVSSALKYATIIVAIVPIMMVYPFIQKYFAKGVMVGSIKG